MYPNGAGGDFFKISVRGPRNLNFKISLDGPVISRFGGDYGAESRWGWGGEPWEISSRYRAGSNQLFSYVYIE